MCNRKIGYDILGYRGIPETAHGLVTLDMGEAIHLMVQRYLVKLGWIESTLTVKNGEFVWKNPPIGGCEIPFKDEKRRLSGRCDGITVPLLHTDDGTTFGSYTPHPDGVRYLVEIKSISDRSTFLVRGIRDGGKSTISTPSEFLDITAKPSRSSKKLQQLFYKYLHSRKVVESWGVRECPVYSLNIKNSAEPVTVTLATNILGKFSNLRGPVPYHLAQASAYAQHFGLEDILFIYVGKDADPAGYEDAEDFENSPIKVFHHKVDSTDLALIDIQLEEIYSFVDAGKLPPHGHSLGDRICDFCPYKWQCFPGSVDVDKINSKLEAIGMQKLVEGPPGTPSRKKQSRAATQNSTEPCS